MWKNYLKTMINPKEKLWKWGSIDGQILYVDNFMERMLGCKNIFGISWSDCLIHIKDAKVLFVSSYDDLYAHGEMMFKKFILKEKERTKYYNIWIEIRDALVSFVAKYTEGYIGCAADEELSFIFEEFHRIYDSFWDYGLLPEVANFGGERLLGEWIKKHHPTLYVELFEALSAPTEYSFYQVEELERLKIRLLEPTEIDKAAQVHQKKYFWLENSYGEVKVKSVHSFKSDILDMSKEEAEEKIAEIESYQKEILEKKEKFIKELHIPKDIQDIAEQLSFSIWWQDYRKKHIFIALHELTLIAKEVGKRKDVLFEDLLLYARKDLIKLHESCEQVKNLDERREGYISYYEADTNSGKNYFGKEANALVAQYTNLEVEEGVSEVKGMVVSKGKVQGKVRILSGSRHFDAFKEGEILLASMTSPEYIVAMRKSAAIVTDEGGITCHAAIVSRELKKPCIVGTRIATRVFKDGDLIEVDAEKGIVKKG